MLTEWFVTWIVKGAAAALSALPAPPQAAYDLLAKLDSTASSLALSMPYRDLVPWSLMSTCLVALSIAYAASVALALAYRVFSWVRSLGKSSD